MDKHDAQIDLSDIPEVTDFSNAIKNPFAGKFKDGYTVIVEHEGYIEERIYDFTKIPYPANGGIPIPVAVNIIKVGSEHDIYIGRKPNEVDANASEMNDEWIDGKTFWEEAKRGFPRGKAASSPRVKQ